MRFSYLGIIVDEAVAKDSLVKEPSIMFQKAFSHPLSFVALTFLLTIVGVVITRNI